MNTETNQVPPQVDKGERYCSDCNSQVNHDAEVCPSCKKILFAEGRPSWLAGLIGYSWGFLLGIITCVIFVIIAVIFGLGHNKFFYGLAMVISGFVFFTAKASKKAKLMSRHDLAVWKKVAKGGSQ